MSTAVNKKILVVEDDGAIRDMVLFNLRRSGFEVLEATDCREARIRIADHQPDLILLDLVMPGMTGTQFLGELRKTHPHLPVVIVTGYPDGNLMQEAMQYAPLMLLAKPVDVGLLEQTVRTAVGEKMSTRSAR